MTRRLAVASTQALLFCLVAAAIGACTSPTPVEQPSAPGQPAAVRPAASPEPTSAARPDYRCELGIDFTVRFGDGTALIDAGPRGREQLLRDAGGMTPQQTVYSNQQLRAEFGLGADGREAILHYVAPPLRVRCTRG